MKKKFMLLVVAFISLLLIPKVKVKAVTIDEEGFFADGKKIVIKERADEEDGAHIEYDGTSTDVGIIDIYGGSKDEAVENTEIVFEGGTVKNIYGGGYGQGSVTENVSITVTGGEVKEFIFAGGNSNAKVENAKIEVNLSTDEASVPVVAHSYGNATVGNTEITTTKGKIINFVELKVKYKDKEASELVPTGILDIGKLNELRSSVIEAAKISNEDVSEEFYYDERFENAYNSENIADDSTGLILYLKPLKYTFKLVYGNIEVPRTYAIGHEISEGDLIEIFEEFLKETGLTEEVFENMEFYLDEDMTIALDTEEFETSSINEDLTLYVNIVSHKEDEGDEITENPDTADINLVLVIGAMLVGSLGLGYTIKKRRFN